ncbi:hypothetical protein E2320_014377, partial [Naja naja]
MKMEEEGIFSCLPGEPSKPAGEILHGVIVDCKTRVDFRGQGKSLDGDTGRSCGQAILPQVKGESEEDLTQQWEVQWKTFLRTMESSHSGWGMTHFPEDPSLWEDAKTFLDSFEQVAKACRWPREQWVVQLLPALSGEARQAFDKLEAGDQEDYGKGVLEEAQAVFSWAPAEPGQRALYVESTLEESDGQPTLLERPLLPQSDVSWLGEENKTFFQSSEEGKPPGLERARCEDLREIAWNPDGSQMQESADAERAGEKAKSVSDRTTDVDEVPVPQEKQQKKTKNQCL